MLALAVTLVAVAAVMAPSWRGASRWQMGLSGVLSMVLGVRLLALTLTGLLMTASSVRLRADEPDVPVPTTAVAAEAPAAESGTTTRVEVVEPTGAAAAQSTTAEAEPMVAEAPDRLVPARAISVPKATARPPVDIVTNVRYLSSNRPNWVEEGPTDDSGVYTVTVRAGPYRTVRDCERDLQQQVSLVVSDYVNTHLAAPHASQFIRYSLNDLRARKVVQEQFSEQLETSVGLMNQVHLQLAFGEPFQEELDQRWLEIKSKSRLAQMGIGTAIVLLLLGTLFGFLKLDTATRGYYTGRLQLAASAAILALVAASVLLMKWIPWM